MKTSDFKIKLTELSEIGYEDITISESDLIELFKRHSTELPILIGDNKVWIHINNNVDKILIETDISENTIELEI